MRDYLPEIALDDSLKIVASHHSSLSKVSSTSLPYALAQNLKAALRVPSVKSLSIHVPDVELVPESRRPLLETLTRRTVFLLVAIFIFIDTTLLDAGKPALAAFSANVAGPGASRSVIHLLHGDPGDTSAIVVIRYADICSLGTLGALANSEGVGVPVSNVIVVRLAQILVFIIVSIYRTDLATLEVLNATSVISAF